MNKIIEYQILGTEKFSELVKEVNKAIKKGWQPLGGVSIDNFMSQVGIPVQAMVKYENDKN